MTTYRLLTPGMRRMLLIASVLVFTIGIPLFLFSEQTARFFAWTINPPLTAAFLGAAYWASFCLEYLASRERLWANGRVAVPAVFIFTTVTLLVTLLHLNRFHFNFPLTDPDAYTTDALTLTGTWGWLAVYALVPVVMGLLWWQQVRQPGGDPPIHQPIPPLARWVMGGQAAVMLGLGLALFLVPLTVAPLWPWQLTPLTGRAIGAWLLGLGIATAHVAYEQDWQRVRAGTVGYTAFGLLQLIALARYGTTLNWDSLNAWLYLLFLVSILVVGAYGVYASRQTTPTMSFTLNAQQNGGG